MPYAQTLMVDESAGTTMPAVLVMIPAGLTPGEVGNFHRALIGAGFEVIEPPTSVAAARTVPASAQVRVGEAGFRIVVTGWEHAPLVDDPGPPPVPPLGWWQAVADLEDQCALLVAPRLDVTDLEGPRQLDAAAATGQVLTARARVMRHYP